MPIINFSFKSKQKREEKPKNIIIKNDVIGLVIKADNGMKVNYENINYLIDPRTLTTKDKKIVYALRKDKYGHRIKIIRSEGARFDIGTQHYANVCPGLYVLGNIIENAYGTLFYIKKIIDYGVQSE